MREAVELALQPPATQRVRGVRHRAPPRPLDARGGAPASPRGDAAHEVVRRRDGPSLVDVEQGAVDDLDAAAEAPERRDEPRAEERRRDQLQDVFLRTAQMYNSSGKLTRQTTNGCNPTIHHGCILPDSSRWRDHA